jgi:hypothetical protein
MWKILNNITSRFNTKFDPFLANSRKVQNGLDQNGDVLEKNVI